VEWLEKQDYDDAMQKIQRNGFSWRLSRRLGHRTTAVLYVQAVKTFTRRNTWHKNLF
jgi:hypothetical protein